ncbi:MAG: putative adenylate cyclase [Deltaproteobacteria bacterium]|jgi:TolB-like protein|nr:putative adenylate cyclase [Deltaproteobacteria bacterium]
MVEISRPSIQIDLNEFKLHLHLKGSTQLTLHFNSPSRRFYLSVIALVINEMKKLGKLKSIPLQGHLDLLALLNESVGGAAGSSEKENLLHRIYAKWKNALPNLEEAPLFKVLGKKREEGEGTIGRSYSLTDAEKDGWANLFEYTGSNENVRLKFAIDKIGVGLNETSIIFGDSRNGEAWDKFISSLKNITQEESGQVEEAAIPEPPAVPFPSTQERKIVWFSRYRWILLIVVIGIVAGAFWKIFLSTARIEVASVDRMKYPLPDKPSIAVLPFVNLSKDADQEYFSDGMTDDLITDLSKISDLLVIARNSAFIYKGKSAKVKQVAEELGVRYVLEGSVRRAGDEIRINAQLIDAMTGHHVWAERYDGSMKDVFTLQDRITQKIVSALAVKLTGTEKQTIEAKGINNVEAYDTFLRGWAHYLRMTPVDLSRAIQSFKKAIELDPNYGRAHAALALAYWTGTYVPGVMKGLEVSWLEARLRVGQYLKLAMKNPTATAHQVNGLTHLLRRQHEEAIAELERALVLDPNDPSIYQDMGLVLNLSGKPKEAIDFLNRGMRLDPHNPARYLIFLGVAQFCMGNLEEAANLIEKARRINPEMTGSSSYLAVIYGLLGRQKDARAALETYIKVWGGPTNPRLSAIMYPFPFKDQAVADRFAEGMVKAGIAGPPSAYFPSYKENQLTGDEIKKLLLGSKITGITWDGKQWWNERKKDGETTLRGPEPIFSDTGKSRVEGDLLCTQFQKSLWGIEYCMTVFRNPRGTYEGKDEYLNIADFGFSPWSIAR